jgi:hypothetical protein
MTTTFLSYQRAINAIKLIYKKQGFTIAGNSLADNVYNEFNIEIKYSKIASLFAFIDEYIVLLRLISEFYLLGVSENNKYSKTYYRLAIRQIKHLTSIRLLCSYGLDNNARTILRLLYETSLVWSRFKLDINFLDEYTTNWGLKESNEFWHKYIKSSKTQKYITEEITRRNLTWLGSVDKQISHMQSILSATSHPSNLTDIFNVKTDFKSQFIGVESISESSHFTLTYSIMCTAMPFSILPDPDDNFKIEKNYDTDFLLTNTNLNTSFEYYSELKKLIPILFLMSTKFSNELNEKL